jgi:hypothetical protein
MNLDDWNCIEIRTVEYYSSTKCYRCWIDILVFCFWHYLVLS